MNLIIMLHLLLPELELSRLYKIVHISSTVISSLTVKIVVVIVIIIIVLFLVSAIVAVLE